LTDINPNSSSSTPDAATTLWNNFEAAQQDYNTATQWATVDWDAWKAVLVQVDKLRDGKHGMFANGEALQLINAQGLTDITDYKSDAIGKTAGQSNITTSFQDYASSIQALLNKGDKMTSADGEELISQMSGFYKALTAAGGMKDENGALAFGAGFLSDLKGNLNTMLTTLLPKAPAGFSFDSNPPPGPADGVIAAQTWAGWNTTVQGGSGTVGAQANINSVFADVTNCSDSTQSQGQSLAMTMNMESSQAQTLVSDQGNNLKNITQEGQSIVSNEISH